MSLPNIDATIAGLVQISKADINYDWRIEDAIALLRAHCGEVTVTTNEAGDAVAVTRTDEEHRILSIIWERQK